MHRTALTLGMALALFTGLAAPAFANVTMAELLADPPADAAGDVNHDGTRSAQQDEFVELVNDGAQPVDLSNWSLSDAAKVRHTFAAGTSLAPGERLVIFGGGQPQDIQGKVITASSGMLSLNNGGDVLTLRDAAMGVKDSLSYGSVGEEEQSLVRNGAGELILHTSLAGADGALFSPGRSIQ